MSETKRHYAVGKKAKLFALFDQDKRPSDIDDAPVTRKTLYAYFSEWRREKRIDGKKTGFAVKKFNRKAYLEAKEQEKRRKEKEGITRLVMDWEAILEALKRWDGDFEHTSERIYLPGRGSHSWLRQVLKQKEDSRGKSVYLTREENLTFHEKWVEIGKKAQDKTDFKRFCREQGIGFPAEVDEIRVD